jgi:hypothetical protein
MKITKKKIGIIAGMALYYAFINDFLLAIVPWFTLTFWSVIEGHERFFIYLFWIIGLCQGPGPK